MISIAKFILMDVQYWPFYQHALQTAATHCVRESPKKNGNGKNGITHEDMAGSGRVVNGIGHYSGCLKRERLKAFEVVPEILCMF